MQRVRPDDKPAGTIIVVIKGKEQAVAEVLGDLYLAEDRWAEWLTD
jgi:hypothetical protein